MSAPKLTEAQRRALALVEHDRHANTVPRPTLRVLARLGLVDWSVSYAPGPSGSGVRHCEITPAGLAALRGES